MVMVTLHSNGNPKTEAGTQEWYIAVIGWTMIQNLSLHLKKAAEARHVSGVSLNGGLERPLPEAMKMKPGLPWRT